MKKKNLKPVSLALCVALSFSAAPQTLAAETVTESSAYVSIDSKNADILGYVIHNYTYYNLRALAYYLHGTASRFDINWNKEAKCIEVTSGKDYSGASPQQEHAYFEDDVYSPPKAVKSNAPLMIDGKEIAVSAYNIDGNTYYKLRDLGNVLGYETLWENKNNGILTICPVGDLGYLAKRGSAKDNNAMTDRISTNRWSNPQENVLYQDKNGLPATVSFDAQSNSLTADFYDNGRNLSKSTNIAMELPLFGGFYSGDTYNYIVFGQNNEEMNDNKEVLRIVKYDKDFNRIGACSVYGGEAYTAVPLRSGNLRMAEGADGLIVHTSRQRYDGHQSQLTLVINPDTMTVTNELGKFQSNHVSHSFNQFVQYEGSHFALVDHGDAYPRSVVLQRSRGGEDYEEIELFAIPGEIGANCTGVTVGGFEVSDSSEIVAINTIDHSKVTAYDSYAMTGLDLDERDILLLVCARSGNSVKQIKLTDYSNKGMLGSTPYLVKLSDNRFMVLWEEFVYDAASSYNDTTSNGVCYVIVDGKGEQQGSVQKAEGAHLSADCQPLALNGKVTWYINRPSNTRMFYEIKY